MKKVFLMLMTMSLMFSSCNSDSSDSTDQGVDRLEAATSSNLKKLRAQALSDINTGGKVYYSSSKGAVFYSKSKSHIIIPAHAITTKNGKVIDGEIEIDFIEIFTKEKMVVTNKPTMSKDSKGTKDLLVTGGEFYLDIKYKDEQVEIVKPIQVNIDTSNSKADPNGMSLWSGDIDENDNLTWDTAPKDQVSFGDDGVVFNTKTGSQFYNVFIKITINLGWTNIDKILVKNGPRTTVHVQVPLAFNYTNSAVYIIVRGENNVLFQLSSFDFSNNAFGDNDAILPEGLDCYIVFTGEHNGNYVYSIIPTTLQSNAFYTIPSSSLITTTNYRQLEAAIEALP
ncbi:hypothetical protein [Flavobacterium sp. HSC-61S13]|uniref:hypothetical protein n=1 Tax=Flavobacterium sp. HSC-61S13 TaxID=2910963 RepID=UPI0020A1CDA2|nr:hypothetical protein [Flavobacterium sp. HSC-61S13]MCP1996865.1 hypothetical protein [Flavobacterium sp. HSC-61S13]